MKYLNYILIAGLLFALSSCSKTELDRINTDLNNAKNVQAANELPTVMVESSFGTTGTDIAWYSSVFVEQSAGTYGQLRDADRRNGANVPSLFNNNWNSVYDNLMVLKDIITKCSPNGSEPNNKATLGIAQVLTAYNLAVTTDVWGQVPWTEALMGSDKTQPVYDKQQDIYTKVLFTYLNNAIDNLSNPVSAGDKAVLAKQDLIYEGNISLWKKAAWSLKARYFMHMQKVVPSAVDSALACIPNGFQTAGDAFLFNKYEATSIGENPWYQFLYDRSYLCSGETLYNIMKDRNDPRISAYFTPMDANGTIIPAPNGIANQSFSGDEYSYSLITDEGRTTPTPLMSYHELKFIEAEALARKGQDFLPAFKLAIQRNFEFHGLTYDPSYFTNEVEPRLGTTSDSKLTEVLTQKYIAFYEAESIESYNDYRRTRIPALNNPNNNLATYGFVERFPYPTSEEANNSAHIPSIDVFNNKVWWAGGTE
jgi:Starch-binding associating with outer membrane